MALTKAQRAKINPNNFGLPGTDNYPINTRKRAQSALSRVAANGTPTEQHTMQQRVAAKPTPTGAGLKSGAAKTTNSAAAKKTTAKRPAAKPMRRGK
jgi:hypothetical protein